MLESPSSLRRIAFDLSPINGCMLGLHAMAYNVAILSARIIRADPGLTIETTIILCTE